MTMQADLLKDFFVKPLQKKNSQKDGYEFCLRYWIISICGSITMHLKIDVPMAVDLCLDDRAMVLKPEPKLTVILVAGIYIEIKVARAGILVEADMVVVKFKPELGIAIKDGFDISFGWELSAEPLPELRVSAYIDTITIEVCLGFLPCGSDWDRWKSWDIAKIKLMSRLFKFGSPRVDPTVADPTAPDAGQVVAAQVGPQSATVTISGFQDEETDISRIEIWKSEGGAYTEIGIACGVGGDTCPVTSWTGLATGDRTPHHVTLCAHVRSASETSTACAAPVMWDGEAPKAVAFQLYSAQFALGEGGGWVQAGDGSEPQGPPAAIERKFTAHATALPFRVNIAELPLPGPRLPAGALWTKIESVRYLVSESPTIDDWACVLHNRTSAPVCCIVHPS